MFSTRNSPSWPTNAESFAILKSISNSFGISSPRIIIPFLTKMITRLSIRAQVLKPLACRSSRIHARALGTFAATPPSPFVGPSPHVLKAHNEEKLHEYASYLTLCMPKFIQAYAIQHGELCLHTSPSALLPLCEFLRDHTACQYRQVVDICGVDYPTRKDRFEVVYNLLSHSLNQRIRVKCRISEGEPLESVTGIWSGANWYEREAWDMFGIFFVGHPDLRRILTDYGLSSSCSQH